MKMKRERNANTQPTWGKSEQGAKVRESKESGEKIRLFQFRRVSTFGW
jgi:hypothetical protein